MRTASNRTLGPGSHILGFDGRDDDGRQLADGVYFARLDVGGGRTFTDTRKIVIVR